MKEDEVMLNQFSSLPKRRVAPSGRRLNFKYEDLYKGFYKIRDLYLFVLVSQQLLTLPDRERAQ